MRRDLKLTWQWSGLTTNHSSIVICEGGAAELGGVAGLTTDLDLDLLCLLLGLKLLLIENL